MANNNNNRRRNNNRNNNHNNNHNNNQRQRDDGGRRFDEYVHDEQYPNPLDTVARLRRQEKKRKLYYLLFGVEVGMYISVLLLVGNLLHFHNEMHKKNGCAMTFIYRPMIFNPINVQGNTIEKYQLLQYHEGYRDESTLEIDIPVLFVPGSSGSGKQIRSLGTTILNITTQLRDKFHYRFVFFACDFDEEFSFLSGATLIRQREFVVQSIETISRMYASHGINKLVLIGHSFGGTILYSLPAHKRFNPDWMELVISLGAPIANPPVNTDYYMDLFYHEARTTWTKQPKLVRNITMVSYSGGFKDFMIPDHLAGNLPKYTQDVMAIDYTRDSRLFFRPSWSLWDVACEVDHNCLAWCNQLIKHISNLVVSYGKEWKLPNSDEERKTSRKIVREFYDEYDGREKISGRMKKEKFNLFNDSLINLFFFNDHRIVKTTAELPYVGIVLDVMQFDLVINIRSRVVKCQPGVKANPLDMTFRSNENLTTYSVQEGEWKHLHVMPTFRDTFRLFGIVQIGGNPKCEYEVISAFDLNGTLYRKLLESTYLLFIVFYGLFSVAFIPMARDNILPAILDTHIEQLIRKSWWSLNYIIVAVILGGGAAAHFYVMRNLVTYVIWVFGARLICFLVGMPVQPITRLICRLVDRFPWWIRVPFRLLFLSSIMFTAIYNINFAYAAVLFFYLFRVGSQSRNGACLILLSMVIVISTGLAGNVRDGPAGIFERSLYEQYPNGFMDALFILFVSHPHPLLYSFILMVFFFLIDAADVLKGFQVDLKKGVLLIFYCLLGIALFQLSNLEEIAISTAYYTLVFEFYREYRDLKATDQPRIE